MNRVINEVKTMQMQDKVIKSLSNIEHLMVNKLANTQQKYAVLRSSDKRDVVDFLQRERSTSGRKSSSSKFKKKLRNVRSISKQKLPWNPPAQFVDRASTLD